MQAEAAAAAGAVVAQARPHDDLRGKDPPPPPPKISALLRKRPVLLRANFVLTKDRKWPYYRLLLWYKIFSTGRGLVVKRSGG